MKTQIQTLESFTGAVLVSLFPFFNAFMPSCVLDHTSQRNDMLEALEFMEVESVRVGCT